MGVLGELKSKKLDNDLESLYGKFFTKSSDADSRKQLNSTIDSTGLKSPKTMQLVGLLQRTGKLQPGLYKELVGLSRRFEEGESSAPKTETTSVSSTEETKADKAKVERKEVVTEVKDNVVHIEGFNLTDKDKEKLKEKLQKEEEKIRKRLMKYEEKAVERLKARAEKKAQRQGMKLEEMQEIKDRKEKLTKIKEELKTLRASAKVLKDEIKALRPKREKKEKTEEEKAAKAEKKEKHQKSA